MKKNVCLVWLLACLCVFSACGGKASQGQIAQNAKDSALRQASALVANVKSKMPDDTTTRGHERTKMVEKQGFRVQISPGPGREVAVKAKEIFLRKYTSQDAYLEYNEPAFRVRVGNFEEKGNATKFCNEVRRIPGLEGAFVVKSKIMAKYVPPAERDTSAYYILLDSAGNQMKIYY